MTNVLDRWIAAAVAALSAIALLYVGYCQLNMNAPWLYRDQAFVLFLSVPIAFIGGAVLHLAGVGTALRRISTWVFYLAALVAIVQLLRFFASAYAISHAF